MTHSIEPQMINRRVKEVREALHLTQAQFSRIISLSSGYLAGIELEQRKVNGRLVKLICSAFNVSAAWLNTGEGGMFNAQEDEEFTKFTALFKELSPKYKNYILKQIDLLLNMQDDEG
jgi:transcriptional regulator with XRE-family HTH domain